VLFCKALTCCRKIKTAQLQPELVADRAIVKLVPLQQCRPGMHQAQIQLRQQGTYPFGVFLAGSPVLLQAGDIGCHQQFPVALIQLPQSGFLLPAAATEINEIAPQPTRLRCSRLIHLQNALDTQGELEALGDGQRLQPSTGLFHRPVGIPLGDLGQDALGLAGISQRMIRLPGEETQHSREGMIRVRFHCIG